MRTLFVITLLAALVLPSGHASGSPPIDISAEELQTLHTQADQGDTGAQVRLGTLNAWGDGVPKDYAQAAYWFEKAAVQGDAVAQRKFGVLYQIGRGVSQDYVKARQWYEKAAAQGEARAQFNLGWLYENGQGVLQDYVKAREWFEQAAAQGYAWAQYRLGELYAEGLGVSQDDVRAYMWNNLAAANSTGNEQKVAADNRDKVARRMTPAQIAEAHELARAWKPKLYKRPTP